MAGQYAARLGVMLGLDMAEFSAGVDKAIAENKKLKVVIERESKAAAKEIDILTYAIEDYGKEITNVTRIEREFGQNGKYAALAVAGATVDLKEKLLAKAAALDAVAVANKKANEASAKSIILDKETKTAAKEIQNISYAIQDYGVEVSNVTKIQREFAEGGKYANLALSASTVELKNKLLSTAAVLDAIVADQKRSSNLANSNIAIENASKAALKDIQNFKYAIQDYGKEVTQVVKIQRDFLEGGRLTNASKELKAELLKQAAAYDAVALAAQKSQAAQIEGLSKQQKIGLGYQTTDIVTSLAGGQNPFLVMIQQGGQLKDLFGGIGPMFKALGSYITFINVGVTALASSIGVLAYSYYLGSEESKKFNNNLILTGNYAGITYDKYNELAVQIAKTGQISVGNSKDIVGALASSGKFTESTFASVGKAIALVSRLTGESADSVAKELIPAFDGSAQAAASLSEKYHFLSLAQYKQLEILDRQKDKEAAIKLVSDALKDSIDEQGNKLGYLTNAWNLFKNTLESFKGIGATSLEKDLATLKEDLSKAKEGTDFYIQTLLEIEQLEKRIKDRREKAIVSNAEHRKT